MPHQYEGTNHGSVIDVTFFFDRAVLRLLFSKSFDLSDLQILTTSLIFYFFIICLSSILCASPVSHPPLEVGLKVKMIVEIVDNSQVKVKVVVEIIADNSQITTKVYIVESYYKHFHDISQQRQFNSIL